MQKSIIITGASGNLGRAVSDLFLQEGYRVFALVSPARPSGLEVMDGLQVIPLDLLDEQLVSKSVAEIAEIAGSIDFAVFAAGGFIAGDFVSARLEDMDKMYRLNYVTAYNIARQVYISMREQQEGGQMVFIGSRPAIEVKHAKDTLAYAVSKSMVVRLAQIINAAETDDRVSASVIIPGIIDTPQNRASMPGEDFSKWVSPVELAEKILYLTTPEGRAKSEEIIKVY